MKNDFPKADLEKSYNHYLKLRENPYYQWDYGSFASSRELHKSFSRSRNKNCQEIAEIFLKVRRDAEEKIKKDWEILIPLDPDMDFEPQHLRVRKVEPNSPLAFFLYAYAISLDDNLVRPRRASEKQEKIKKRSAFEKRRMKIAIYLMYKSGKFSYTQLGRSFNKDKNTIKAWVSEAEDWTEGDKSAAANEFLTGKQVPNVDVYDLFRAQLRPLREEDGKDWEEE